MPLKFLSFPDELISKILGYTDCETLLSCRRSCHHLRGVVDTSSALRYCIELYATGMCDGSSSHVGPAERLDRLRRSQTSWKSTSWYQPACFPYSEKISPFLMAQSGNLMMFHTFISENRIGDLLLLRFPSELRGISEQQWYLDLSGDNIESVCIDDSQDLLIFFSLPLGAIRVRTLSTGGVHPLTSAVDPIYSCGVIDEPGDFSLNVYNEFVAFLSNAVDFYILVLNWKTGDLVAKIPSSRHTYSCSFLSNSSIIFPYNVSDRMDDRSMYLRVVTLPNTADSHDAPSHPYDFAVDVPVHRDVGSQSLQMHYMCANTLPTHPSASDFPGLFHGDPGSRILPLEIETATMTDESLPLFMLHVLFISHNTLLSHISKHRSDTDTVIIPWQDWVPGSTHLVEVPHPSPLRYRTLGIACGMHALTSPPTIIKQGESELLRIVDYHPRRIARLLSTQGTCHSSTSRVGTATEESSRPNTTAEPLSGTGVPLDAGIPYVTKDIPLPDGRLSENTLCILGEDVVVLFEYSYSLGNDGNLTHQIERVFYHPI
ncbi:hypothetical protein BC827DRAFT_1197761 [Russula dissimulans]|nr:hypothetical protein BC827DRAFT_1197761 [Russula dissimulans]